VHYRDVGRAYGIEATILGPSECFSITPVLTDLELTAGAI